ncbi:unnamed protein product [Pedinophyceae sp. YPF-701]|nr:unnamed protein product [Pedinophyceae sp. YPF-701]
MSRPPPGPLPGPPGGGVPSFGAGGFPGPPGYSGPRGPGGGGGPPFSSAHAPYAGNQFPGPPQAAPGGAPQKSTSIFVGKIPASVPDDLIRKVLDQCGKVKGWKRMEDPDTRCLKPFGFCEYADAEGAITALTVLPEAPLPDGARLTINAKSATSAYLEHWKAERRSAPADDGPADIDARLSDSAQRATAALRDLLGGAPPAQPDEAAAFLDSVLGGAPPPAARADSPRGHAPRRASTPPRGRSGGRRTRSRSPENEEARALRAREAREARQLKQRERDVEDLEVRWRRNAERERRRVEAAAKDRERELRDDNEVADSDEDLEPAERTPLAERRGFESRRRAREAEEAADDADRREEAREKAEAEAASAAAAQVAAAGHGSNALLQPIVERDARAQEGPPAQARGPRMVEPPAKLRGVAASLPNTWEELSQAQVDWAEYDKLVARGAVGAVTAWVTRKVAELLGEEEPSLVEFILGKVAEHASPQALRELLQDILDDETQMFLLKLFRTVLYEIGKSKVG